MTNPELQVTRINEIDKEILALNKEREALVVGLRLEIKNSIDKLLT